MSLFRRRGNHNERPFVSWAPSAQPDPAAQTEAAAIPANASTDLDTLPDRPAPHKRGRRS